MKIKRLIATALAAAMIFGLVSVGLAAGSTLPDVEGHEFEEEIRTLAGLKVIEGYPDGEFKADNKLTRAEFTALIIRMSGLEGMAKGLAGESVPFADVEGTHWASGHILLAEAMGIINGYPDGTFKPENSVTHSEAIKMVLTAMGYKEEGFPVLRWPVTWLIKADEIGIDKGITILGDLPITRADVAKVLHNSMDKPHQRIKEGEFDDTDATFLAKMGFEPVKGQVVSTPELWDNEEDKVWICMEDKEGKQESEPSDFDLDVYEGLLGHMVEIWKDDDGKVFHVTVLSTEKELTWKEYEKQIIDDKKIDEPEYIFVNYQSGSSNKITKDMEDIVVVYDGKTPIAAKALEYEIGKVTDIIVTRDVRKDLYVSVDGAENRLRLAKAEVEYVGVDDINDIKKGDTVHYISYPEDGKDEIERAILIVMKDVIEGTVTEIRAGGKWKVGGQIYEVPKGTEEVELGTKVTLYLDKDGKVFYVDPEAEAATGFAGIVLDSVLRRIDGDSEYSATILTASGEIEYKYEKVGGGEARLLSVGEVVYENKAGDLSVLETVYEVPEADDKAAHAYAFEVEAVNKNRVTFKEYASVAPEVTDYEDVVWLEKVDGEYQVEPRPKKGDTVELYAIEASRTDAIKVGIIVR